MIEILLENSSKFHQDSIIPLEIAAGSKIKIIHEKILEPLVSDVVYVEGNVIRTNVPEKYLNNELKIGNSVILKYNDQFREYTLKGTILDFTFLFRPNFFVKIHNVQRNKYLRQHVRYPVLLAADIVEDEKVLGRRVIVRDISLLGLSFTEPNSVPQIEMGTYAWVTLYLPGDLVEFYGKIVRVQKYPGFTEYGIFITQIEMDQRKKLDKYIEKLETNAM